MNNEILIVGSAHLDIVATYEKNETNTNVYKDGSFQINVGGVAYNIACNLRYHDKPVCLFTVTNKNTFSGQKIKDAILQRHIRAKILEVNESNESGFIAQMYTEKENATKRLESGITAPLIDITHLNLTDLEKEVKNSKLVAIDCNIRSIDIQHIAEFCCKYDKPLFVCSVSESKITRAVFEPELNRVPYKLFCLNSSEAKILLSNWQEIKNDERERIIDLCVQYNSENVVITNGKEGFFVFTSHGQMYTFNAVRGPVKSELGAGDALFAAIVAYFYDTGKISWPECYQTIHDFVKIVLASESSVPPLANREDDESEEDSIKYRIVPEYLNTSSKRKKNVRIMNCQMDISSIKFDKYHPGKVDYSVHNQSSRKYLDKITSKIKREYKNGNKIDLVVFPELSISKDQLDELEKLSSETETIIVAGSQYYDEGSTIIDSSNYDERIGDLINASPIIINGEKPILTHKIHPAPAEYGVVSHIKHGSVIKKVCGSKIGNFVVIICYDYIQYEENSLLEDLKKIIKI